MILPTIKTRFHTEDVYRQIWNKQRSFVVKPRQKKKYSIPDCTFEGEGVLNSRTAVNSVNPPDSKLRRQRIKTENISQEKHAHRQIVPEQNRYQTNQSRRTGPKINKVNSSENMGQIGENQANQAYFSMNNKLDQVMRLFEKQQIPNSRIKKVKRSIMDYSSINQSRYDIAAEEFSKLPKQKSKWSIQKLTQFLWALRQINPFFNKINELVALCLLKVGRVKIFHQNEFIQRQDHPMVQMGIVLWGELILKSKGTSLKIFNLPGDSINQEIIFKGKDSKSYEKLYFKPGIESIKESVKSQTKSAILFFNENQYRTIFAELVKIGEKSGILTAQNMMKWSYSKKKNIRKQFSHIH